MYFLDVNTVDFLSCFKNVYETLLVVEYRTVLPDWSSEPRHMHADLVFEKEYASFIVFTHTGLSWSDAAWWFWTIAHPALSSSTTVGVNNLTDISEGVPFLPFVDLACILFFMCLVYPFVYGGVRADFDGCWSWWISLAPRLFYPQEHTALTCVTFLPKLGGLWVGLFILFISLSTHVCISSL